MKKILSLLLVLGLCFGLTGCGGDSEDDKADSKTHNELTSLEGKTLTDSIKKIDELGYKATYMADGEDFTDFIDSVAADYTTGKLTIDENKKTVEVEIILTSNIEAENLKNTLNEKLDKGKAWLAVKHYGEANYQDFDLHYLAGKLAEDPANENTWYLKATCTIGGVDGTCEAKVTGTSENPEVITFDVY